MIKHIFVPLDTSQLAECVLPHAATLAQAFGAQINLLHIMEPARADSMYHFSDAIIWDLKKIEAQAYLEGIAAHLSKSNEPVEYMLLEGKPEDCIIRVAQSNEQSLLLLSSHAQGDPTEWKIGSIVQKIMLRRHVSTMIIRPHSHVAGDLDTCRYRRILVPLDGSQRAECVLPLVKVLAGFHEAHIVLVHIITVPEMPQGALSSHEEQELAEQLTEHRQADALKYLDKIHTQAGLNTEIRVLVSDNAAETLHRLIEEENIDLVVMSAHGHSGKIDWSYGSLVVNFITYGTTPLLIVQDCPEHTKPDEKEVMIPRGVQALLLERPQLCE